MPFFVRTVVEDDFPIYRRFSQGEPSFARAQTTAPWAVTFVKETSHSPPRSTELNDGEGSTTGKSSANREDKSGLSIFSLQPLKQTIT